MTTCFRIAALSLLATFTGAFTAQQAAAQTRATQTRGTQTRTVVDPLWNLPAATVTMPAGWLFDGVASHGDTCVSTLPDIRFAAASADGSLEVQHYPQIRYSYSSDAQANQANQRAGCLITQFAKPEDFLTHVVAPSLHPGERFEIHPVPDSDYTRQERALVQASDQRLSRAGTVSHTEISTLLIGFDHMLQTVHIMEAFVAEFRCTQTRYTGTHLETVDCFVNNAIELRAPEAQMAALMNSAIPFPVTTEVWRTRAHQMLEHRFATESAKMNATFAKDQNSLIAQHKMLMDNQNAQFDAGQQQARRAEQVRHAGDVGAANHMGDVNDYRDPSTGKSYKVSNQYSHTYLDSTGKTIVQTNSAYAPGPDTIWQELQPHK